MNPLRIAVSFFFFLILSTFGYGQTFEVDKKTQKYVYVDEDGKEDKTKIFDDVREFTDQMSAVKTKRKWSIVDKDGEFVGAPSYDDIRPWYGEYAIVKKGEKYGVIDTSLKEVLKFEYDYIDYYHPDSSIVRIDGQWGFLKNEEFNAGSAPAYFRNPEIPVKAKGCKSSNWQCTTIALNKMIQKDMLYPQEAILKKVEGKVVADVYLDEEGMVDEVVLVKGIGSGCEEEAVWAMEYYIEEINPAEHEGSQIRSILRQSINFQLSEKTKKAVDKYVKQKAKMEERRALANAKEAEKRKEREKELEEEREKKAAKEKEKKDKEQEKENG